MSERRFYRVFMALACAGAGSCAVQAFVHPDVLAWKRAALAFFAAAGMCFYRLTARS